MIPKKIRKIVTGPALAMAGVIPATDQAGIASVKAGAIASAEAETTALTSADAPLTPVDQRPDALSILNNPAYGFQDQYGQVFKPTQVLKGKPFILAFGFNGCQLCDQIGGALGEIQQKFRERGGEVPPTVIVSVHPTEDRFKADPKDNPMKLYVEDYANAGVSQFRDESIAYETGKNKPVSGRLLNILTAAQEGQPGDIQAKLREAGIKMSRISTNRDNHTRYIMICDKKGNVATYDYAAVDPNDKKELKRIADWAVRTVDAIGNEAALLNQPDPFASRVTRLAHNALGR